MTATATRADVEAALRGVVDPELGSDVVELGMIQGIEISDGVATINIALTIAACPMRDQIESDVKRKVTSLPGISSTVVNVAAMTSKQRSDLMATVRRRGARGCGCHNGQPDDQSDRGRIRQRRSRQVVTQCQPGSGTAGRRFPGRAPRRRHLGFSVPRMLGTTGRLEANSDRKIVPIEAQGIQLVSTGLLVETEETALMWRGLMLSKALEQFLQDVAWDPGLDYLILDMPPGTGDVQMALARLLPQAEMIVVTTPQKAAQKVAARVADMARRSYMPVVGVIENMSGFTTAEGTHYDLFGTGGGEELANDLGVPLLARVPLDPWWSPVAMRVLRW